MPAGPGCSCPTMPGMPQGGGFAFGAFQLDVRSRRLCGNGTLVPLRPRHFELLHELIAHAGDVVTKDRLMTVAWPGVVVEENTLAQAMSQLRAALDADDPKHFIHTVSGHGYRFVAPVNRMDIRVDAADIQQMLAPYRALVDGRAAVETLELAQLTHARSLFGEALAAAPDDAALHVGLANACALMSESTRGDLAPDTASLHLALASAQEACRLAPEYAEAWATLGFASGCARATADAIAALRRATALEPNNWRHWLRLAYVSWGEELLRAAERTLEMLPGCPIPYWLMARVHVARGRDAFARRELANGLAALPAASDGPSRFSVVAFHLLDGLLRLDAGEDDDAQAAFARELAGESRGHLYARECCAHTWASIGAGRLRRSRRKPAIDAFGQSLARMPCHPTARVGLMILGVMDHPALVALPHDAVAVNGRHVDEAIARAAWLSFNGDVQAAVQVVSAALASEAPGNAGWKLPIEPMLGVRQARDAWSPVLATVRTRAS